MPQQVITANRLLDGRVVFLAANGEWSRARRREPRGAG